MATETTRKRRGTGPVTAMAELPILDEQERAELVASIKEAEAEIKAGKGAEYDARKFKDRLVGIYRGEK
jgi:transcription elongation GreA/GreB family factor